MNHFISLATAASMTAQYRAHTDSLLAPAYQNQGILPICETFDKEAFATLLAKTACTQLRVYYGMDEGLKIHAIIVAVDASGQDILPSFLAEGEGSDDDIFERGIRCPDLCPPASPLNS